MGIIQGAGGEGSTRSFFMFCGATLKADDQCQARDKSLYKKINTKPAQISYNIIDFLYDIIVQNIL